MKYKKITGSIDLDYQLLTGREGLFCIAFFGHKGTRQQMRKKNYIWKRLLKIYGYVKGGEK